MTDHTDSVEPDDRSIAALLSRADTWDEPDPAVETAVVHAIEEARTAAAVASLNEGRRARARGQTVTRPRMLVAAAAIVLVVAGVALVARDRGVDTTVFALSGTDAAPGAAGEATVAATPAGLKILLSPRGLAGAPDGFMYEAWVSDGTIRVSAGTFHLRGGDGTIELWAGVTDPSFDRLAVTLEPIDDDASSTGDARLVGHFAGTD